jgi:signal transduction histidine kinase
LERSQLLKISTETEKERQQLSALINSVRDSVLVLDNHDRIAISNEAAAQLIGGKANLKGKVFHEQVQFADDEGQPMEFKIKHSTTPLRKDVHIRAADKSLVSVEISVAPYIVDRQNRGNVVILHDNSEDKSVAQEREEFIAVTSHELRTPLTIAESDISTLLTPSYLPENKESVTMLNGALRSLTQLSHIINDLTNLSQVRDEKLEIQLEPLNPMGLLREFHADYIDQAKAKGLDLSVVTDQTIDAPTIMTSRYVVQEILTIFVSNAVKFTEEGKVTLALVRSKEKDGITFSVKDTGIGISQSDQKKIFEKFFQSEHYTNRVHGGTGLGLYIAKELSNRITAKIWFESELNKGSTFFLWVPPYSKNSKDRQKVAQAETKDFFDKV